MHALGHMWWSCVQTSIDSYNCHDILVNLLNLHVLWGTCGCVLSDGIPYLEILNQADINKKEIYIYLQSTSC